MSDYVLHRREGIMEARVSDEELVLLGPDAEDYFGLDRVASDIWTRLETPQPLETLVEALARDYDAPPETIAEDVAPMIEELVAGGLIERRRADG